MSPSSAQFTGSYAKNERVDKMNCPKCESINVVLNGCFYGCAECGEVWEKAKSAVIKDSGNRREFETGAVRDIGFGKGRMDLLPMCALIRVAQHMEKGAVKYGERNFEKGLPIHSFMDSALRHIAYYMDGATDEDHLCAATWNLLCAMYTEEKKPEMQDIPSRM
jgi:hypothetical protein